MICGFNGGIAKLPPNIPKLWKTWARKISNNSMVADKNDSVFALIISSYNVFDRIFVKSNPNGQNL